MSQWVQIMTEEEAIDKIINNGETSDSVTTIEEESKDISDKSNKKDDIWIFCTLFVYLCIFLFIPCFCTYYGFPRVAKYCYTTIVIYTESLRNEGHLILPQIIDKIIFTFDSDITKFRCMNEVFSSFIV